MTAGRKLILGALGAATPVALNLIVVDRFALSSPTSLALIGYAVRVIVLVALGVLVVARNLDEQSPSRLFLLGLAGPALITALLNGFNQRTLLRREPVAPVATAAFLALPVLYASTPQQRARQFEIPKETGVEQIWRGLTGGRTDRAWFVIALREPTREAAEAASDLINRTVYGFRAEVFEPYQGNGTWCVVIGDGLSHADALRLRERALGAGLSEAELWTPPPTSK
jgi:hypothetical protein